MALSIGTKAPDFALSCKTPEGINLIKLSDNFGRKNTLLLFFPMAFTGVCTTEMCDTSNELGTYQDVNAPVYGISGDSPFALEAWSHEKNIKVPLLSDYDHTVARAYGVAYDSFAPQRNLPMGGVAKRSARVFASLHVVDEATLGDGDQKLGRVGFGFIKLSEEHFLGLLVRQFHERTRGRSGNREAKVQSCVHTFLTVSVT